MVWVTIVFLGDVSGEVAVQFYHFTECFFKSEEFCPKSVFFFKAA